MPTLYIREDTLLPERRTHDHYPTEPTLITAALSTALEYMPMQPAEILEPGAGDGRWGAEAARLTGATRITGVEIRNEIRPDAFTSWYPGQDFLTWTYYQKNPFDMVVGNPPFKYAEGFVRHGWELLAPGGIMVYLLKIGFMASVGRYESLWNEIYPANVFVCSTRPSFYNGSTGGDEYAVFLWKKTLEEKPLGYPRSWYTSLLKYDRPAK